MSPKSDLGANAGIAGMLVLCRSHRVPASGPLLPSWLHLPFVKPRKLLAREELLGKSADCCGKIPAGLGSRGIYYFPSLVSLPIKGERFGDFTLSCKFGMDLRIMERRLGNPSAGVDDGAGVDEVSRLGL